MRLLLPSESTTQPVWVLTVTWAGQDWRWSSEPVSVSSTSLAGVSSTIAAHGGLDADAVDLAVAGLSTAPDQRSMALEVEWPEDVAQLVAEGHDLATARGELALLPTGATWEGRRVLLVGQVSQPEYGGLGEAVAFSLVQDPYDDVNLVPSRRARVTREKFAQAADGALGKYYPTVIGAPGRYVETDGTITYVPGSPAHAIVYQNVSAAADTLLVAGHRCAATEVRIWYSVDGDTDGGVTLALPIAYATDSDGITYAYVDISGQTAEVTGAGKWAAIWSEGAGLVSPFRAAGITSIGEAMAWAAVMSSIPCHVAAWVAVADELPWPVGGYIDEPCSPSEWMRDNLLPLVPVSIACDAEGLYPMLWRHDARRDHAIRTLRAGEGFERVGRVRYTRAPREIINEVRVAWAFDCIADERRAETVLTPEIETTTATSGAEVSGTLRQGSTFDSRRSLSMYGERRAIALETEWVYDGLTAWRIAHWKAREAATSAREVDYDCGLEALELEPGDVVILDDDELHLDVVAQVVAIRVVDRATQSITLQILDPAASSTSVEPTYADETPPRYGDGQ